MRLKILDFLSKINLTKKVCDHLVGKEHDNAHRHMIGFSLMLLGVALAKFTHPLGIPVNFLADVAGYFLHGLGAIPFLQTLLENNE